MTDGKRETGKVDMGRMMVIVKSMTTTGKAGRVAMRVNGTDCNCKH